jgi:hypothetical protein
MCAWKVFGGAEKCEQWCERFRVGVCMQYIGWPRDQGPAVLAVPAMPAPSCYRRGAFDARLRPVIQFSDGGRRTGTLCFLHARLTGAAAAQAGEHPNGLPAEPGRRVRIRAPEPGQRAQGAVLRAPSAAPRLALPRSAVHLSYCTAAACCLGGITRGVMMLGECNADVGAVHALCRAQRIAQRL